MTKSYSPNFINDNSLKLKNCSLAERCFFPPSPHTRPTPHSSRLDTSAQSANKHSPFSKKNPAVFKKSLFWKPSRVLKIKAFIRKVYRRRRHFYHCKHTLISTSNIVKPAAFERIDCTRSRVSSSTRSQSKAASFHITSTPAPSNSTFSNTTTQAVHRVLSREIDSLRSKHSDKAARIDHHLSSSNLLQRLFSYTIDLIPPADPLASSTTGLSSDQLDSIPSVAGYRQRRKMQARPFSLNSGSLNTGVVCSNFYGDSRQGQVDFSVPDFGGGGSLRGGSSIMSPSSRLLSASGSAAAAAQPTATVPRVLPTNGLNPALSPNSQRSAPQASCSTGSRAPQNPTANAVTVNGHFTPRTLKPQTQTSAATLSRACIPTSADSPSSASACATTSSCSSSQSASASASASASCSTSASSASANTAGAVDSSALILHPAITVCARSSIITRWQNPPQVRCGISNHGNNCYMNSVLQVLTYTAPLANYLSTHRKGQCNDFCALCLLRQHMVNVTSGRNDIVSPQFWISNLNCIAKHMRKWAQEDAHEFMRYLLDKLTNDSLVPHPGLDRVSKLTNPINAIFGGFLLSQVVCQRCSNTSSVFDPFLDISLDIRNADSVEQALGQFTSFETLAGPNSYKCERCKCFVQARKRFTIHRAPIVLTLHIKRFSSGYGFSKNSKIVKFPLRFDLSKYSSAQRGVQMQSENENDEERFVSPAFYQLYGVVVHSGGSLQSGHYYAYADPLLNHKWRQFNDTVVREVPEGQVLNAQAYLLLYIRCDSTAAPNSSSASFAPSTMTSAGTLGQQQATRTPIPQRVVNGVSSWAGGSNGAKNLIAAQQGLRVPTPQASPPAAPPLAAASLPPASPTGKPPLPPSAFAATKTPIRPPPVSPGGSLARAASDTATRFGASAQLRSHFSPPIPAASAIGPQPVRQLLQVQSACAEAARSASGAQTPRPALGSKLVRAGSDPRQMHIQSFTVGASNKSKSTSGMVIIRPPGALNGFDQQANSAASASAPAGVEPGAQGQSHTPTIVLNRPLVLPQAPLAPPSTAIPFAVSAAAQSPHMIDINHLGSEVSIVSTTPATESAHATPSKFSVASVPTTNASSLQTSAMMVGAPQAERKRVLPSGAIILPNEMAPNSKRARILVSPEYDEDDTTSTSDSGGGETNSSSCMRVLNGSPDSNFKLAATNGPLQFNNKMNGIAASGPLFGPVILSPSAGFKLTNGGPKQNGTTSSGTVAVVEQTVSRQSGQEAPTADALSPAVASDRQAPFASLNDASSTSSLSSCEFLVEAPANKAASVASGVVNTNSDGTSRG